MNNFLDQTLCWLCTQFMEANNIVEYVSWLTASIFSVLAVFTIFLGHQYQTHTSETIKILWRLQDAVKRELKDEFHQLLKNFEYFCTTPKIITDSINISEFVLKGLVPIWIVSGLTMISKYARNSEGNLQYLSIVLIASITFLFIYFSIKLLMILKGLSNKGNQGLHIKSIEEFKNVVNLQKEGFNLQSLLKIENFNFNLFFNAEEPLSFISIEREIGLTDFSVILTVESGTSTIIVGKSIGTDDLEITIPLKNSSQQKINQFIYENQQELEFYMTFIINEKQYSFNTKYKQDNSDLPIHIEVSFSEPAKNFHLIDENVKKLNANDVLEIVDIKNM